MKMKWSFITCFFLFIGGSEVYGQDFQWAIGIGGSRNTRVEAMAVDAQGNVFITGLFDGTTDFDPGPGKVELTAPRDPQSSTFTDYDIFLAKYSKEGDYLWAFNFGTIRWDWARDMAVDAEGNVYITGIFGGQVDFDPGPGIAVLDSRNGYNFFAKYDNNGNFLLAKNFKGSVRINKIIVDREENIYLTGDFRDTADFDPDTTEAILVSKEHSSITEYDIFFAKYDAKGNYLWAKGIGSTDDDRGNSIALDNLGNVYITGSFSSIIDFDPDTGIAELSGNGYDLDIFLAKYNNNGEYLWAKGIGGGGRDIGKDIVIDDNQNVVLTGYFSDSVDFSTGGIDSSVLTAVGGWDIFISKYDSNGTFQWVNGIGGVHWDEAKSVAVDSYGNCYLTGYFQYTASFFPDSNAEKLISSGDRDIVFAKYNNNGRLLWAKGIGGRYDDYGNAIAVFKNDIYLSGTFGDTVNFSGNADGVVSVVNFGHDTYIAKYTDSASVGIQSRKKADNSIITVSPNPLSTTTVIKVAEPLWKPGVQLYLTIYSITGKEVKRLRSTSPQFTINRDGLPAGLYLYRISGEAGVIGSGKVMVVD